MSTYRLSIDTGNSAFRDDTCVICDDCDEHCDECWRPEVARLLRLAADQLDAGVPADHAITLLDSNGNRVGQHKLHEDDR